MKRRLLLSLLLIGGLGLLCGAGAFATHFYFLSARHSHTIFGWRHRLFTHLAFHLDPGGVQPGARIPVYASYTAGDSLWAGVYDIHRRDTVLPFRRYAAGYQALPARPGVTGTGWQASFALTLPPDLATGWYVVELKGQDMSQRSSLLVVPPDTAVRHRVALVLSTNTWNAYNPWGGHSLYTRNYSPVVSFHRPQPLADPWLPDTYPHYQLAFQSAARDRHVATLLDTAGIGYDVYDMHSLDRAASPLDRYAVLIFSTHTEYWTAPMLAHLRACLDRGASALVLAGNVAAYVSALDQAAGTLTVHKREDQLWQYADTAGLRPFGLEASFLGFHTYSPYAVQQPDHWAWAGTGVQAGDLVGQVSETYDFTYMYDSWWRNLLDLRRKGRRGAAAGMEIDRPYAGTPAHWVTLGQALNPPVEGHGEVWPDPSLDWQVGAGAILGYYDHPGGGLVAHAGSIAFTGALPYDARLRRLVLNLVQAGLQRRPAP